MRPLVAVAVPHAERMVLRIIIYIYIYTCINFRPKPLHRSSCYYRLSLFGRPYRFPVPCVIIAFAGGHIALQCFVHIHDKIQNTAVSNWFSTILIVTHIHAYAYILHTVHLYLGVS